jgi:probable phosphoglycerate mutase
MSLMVALKIERPCYFARKFCTDASKLKSMNVTRILAVRHGETAWNVDTRIQGQIDIPLNDHGRWQAQQLAKALVDEDIHAIYASDLSRALHTAQAVAQRMRDLAIQPQVWLARASLWRFSRPYLGRYSKPNGLKKREQWRVRDPNWTPKGGGESLVMLHNRIETCDARYGGATSWAANTVWSPMAGCWTFLYRMATGQDLQAARTWGLRNTAINRLFWSAEGSADCGLGR